MSKAVILNYHKENLKNYNSPSEGVNSEPNRIDVPKILEEYQQKFHVPKTLLIKWLNLESQKSQFVGVRNRLNESEGSISDASQVSLSVDSLNLSRAISEKNESNKIIPEIIEEELRISTKELLSNLELADLDEENLSPSKRQATMEEKKRVKRSSFCQKEPIADLKQDETESVETSSSDESKHQENSNLEPGDVTIPNQKENEMNTCRSHSKLIIRKNILKKKNFPSLNLNSEFSSGCLKNALCRLSPNRLDGSNDPSSFPSKGKLTFC